MRRWAAWAAWAALAAALLGRLLADRRSPLLCDTTYIHEGYEEVPMSGAAPYRLVAWRDRDSSRAAAFDQLRQRQTVPVLFVHGHLGTHQQMRSAAAETGRELARRLAADPAWPLWLQWYAADFAEEASALDAGLLDQQAAFVLRCIQHLRSQHAARAAASADPRPPPFRLVLVAYSMGGAVARDVLRRLAADPSFDLGEVVALVTLGSPAHFPQLLPHRPLSAYIKAKAPGKPCCKNAAAAAERAAAAAAAAVPRANIAAGAGDALLPHTLGGGDAPALPGEAPELSLLMRDMPGVWTTSGHKGIVSCNQLVRQLVLLLVDAADASVQAPPGGTRARQAAVQALLQDRLATNAARALALPTADGAAAAASQQQQQQQPACPINEAVAAAAEEQAPQPVSGPLLVGPVAPGRLVRLRWEAEDLRQDGGHGLLLLLSAAPPCSHLAVAASYADGSVRALTSQAAALPPLRPGLQSSWAPRPWRQVLEGVDWRQNATHLLYLPLGGGPDGGSSSPAMDLVDVAVRGGEGGATLVLGQVLQAAPSEAPLQLPAPGGGASAALELPGEHAAALGLRLPWWAWPGGGGGDGACGDGLGLSLACLPTLLLGDTPPWRLRIQAQQCDSGTAGDSGSAQLLPAVLGVASGAAPADGVRVAGGGGEPGGAGGVAELWDGLDPARRQLLLLTDPSCSYSLRLEWDVGGWLGLRLRQLLFVLPALCMAASQARLSPARGATARVALLAAVAAAWGSQHPAALHDATGLRPWLRLSVVEAAAALALAAGGASVLGLLQAAAVRVLRQVLPSSATSAAARAGIALVAAAGLVHPALAALCGCTCLAVRLAAGSKHAAAASAAAGDARGTGKAAASAPQRLAPWLAFHAQLALLPCASLYSWLAGGARRAVEWSDGRLLVVSLALHAAALRPAEEPDSGGGSPESGGGQRWRAATLAAVHEAAAAAAAAASLWGHPYVLVYAACWSAAVEGVRARPF